MALKERQQHKDDIVRLYQENKTMVEIGRTLGIHVEDVRQVLKEQGVYIPNKSRTLIDAMKIGEDVKRMYIDEQRSIVDISKEIGVGQKAIGEWLKSQQIDIRNTSEWNRKYSIYNEAFSVFTPESVYWAGFIAGDGCVYSHGRKDGLTNYLNVTLKSDDIEHVDKLKTYLKYDGELYAYKTKNTIGLVANSEQIAKDLLENFNIGGNKSLTYKPPVNTIPPYLVKYFILGLFDADGCLSKSNQKRYVKNGDEHVLVKTYENSYTFQMNITGTYETLDFIQRFFGTDLQLNKRHKDRDSNNYTLQISGNKQIFNVLSALYDERIDSVCLDRKFMLFKELQSQMKGC